MRIFKIIHLINIKALILQKSFKKILFVISHFAIMLFLNILYKRKIYEMDPELTCVKKPYFFIQLILLTDL